MTEFWWQDKPWRMIQTNLREIDMIDIDADQVVADLLEFKATALLFNAAGILASYPTKLPYHFQSPYLTGDSMADVIEACHAAGIHVLARTDFSKIRRPIYEEHPDWAYRTVDGDIVDYNGDVHACVMGEFQQTMALHILEELLTTHDLDGIFFNMGGFQTNDYSGNQYSICHCAACKKAFHDRFGLDLPTDESMDNPVFRKYKVFQREALHVHELKVFSHINRLRPEIAINRDYFRKAGLIRQESNTGVDRALPHWQYSGSANTKWATATYPEITSSNCTVDFIDFPYRHVAVSPHQQALRLAQGMANGGQLDYYLIGRLDNHQDKSGYAPVKEMFHYHAAHGDDYVENASQANVMLLNDDKIRTPESRGWYRFLSEGHFLFDAPLVDRAVEQDWSRYDTIVLADLQYMSDELAAKIDQFVADGGTLIASGKSSFYNQDFERREAPALKSLGIEQVEMVKQDMRSSYLLLDDRTHMVRCADTELAYLDGPYVFAQYAESTKPAAKLVPPHNFGPPERCYYETVVDRPGWVVNAYGKGKAIYVPWLPGALFHRQGHTNTEDLMLDLLEQVAGVAHVGGNLSPMVEVTHWAKKESDAHLVHLVNISGHFGVTFFAPVTMRDLVVELPYATSPASATSLVTGDPVPFSWDDGTLTLQVDKLELMEAIKLV